MRFLFSALLVLLVTVPVLSEPPAVTPFETGVSIALRLKNEGSLDLALTAYKVTLEFTDTLSASPMVTKAREYFIISNIIDIYEEISTYTKYMSYQALTTQYGSYQDSLIYYYDAIIPLMEQTKSIVKMPRSHLQDRYTKYISILLANKRFEDTDIAKTKLDSTNNYPDPDVTYSDRLIIVSKIMAGLQP